MATQTTLHNIISNGCLNCSKCEIGEIEDQTLIGICTESDSPNYDTPVGAADTCNFFGKNDNEDDPGWGIEQNYPPNYGPEMLTNPLIDHPGTGWTEDDTPGHGQFVDNGTDDYYQANDTTTKATSIYIKQDVAVVAGNDYRIWIEGQMVTGSEGSGITIEVSGNFVTGTILDSSTRQTKQWTFTAATTTTVTVSIKFFWDEASTADMRAFSCSMREEL